MQMKIVGKKTNKESCNGKQKTVKWEAKLSFFTKKKKKKEFKELSKMDEKNFLE